MLGDFFIILDRFFLMWLTLEFNRQIEHSKCSCVAIVAAGRVFLGAAFVLEFYVRSGADK